MAGWGWALFIALWSGLLTASVDNLVKPFFLRGDSHIHPLLIFLGVFGGLSWMGVPGVLVGPLIVVFFVALYTIYVEDFLHLAFPLEEHDEQAWGRRLHLPLQLALGRPGHAQRQRLA